MRLRLDSDACQGHGRCYTLAPGLFESDDEGYAVLLVDGELPPDQLEAAQLAVDNCPEFALSLEE
jgi:ferredoxin